MRRHLPPPPISMTSSKLQLQHEVQIIGSFNVKLLTAVAVHARVASAADAPPLAAASAAAAIGAARVYYVQVQQGGEQRERALSVSCGVLMYISEQGALHHLCRCKSD
jgi:hypothetical protein